MTSQAPVEPDPAFGARPSLPYAGTTGYSAPGASTDRAVHEAADGTATARQQRIIALLSDAGTIGMTWAEISRRTGEHHGQVSGALSSLHAEDRVAALRRDRRDGSGVYVLPQYVAGREVRPFAGNGTGRSRRDLEDTLGEATAEIERLQRVLAVNGIADDGTQQAPEPQGVAQTEVDRLHAEVDRLREQNGWQAEEIERLVTERDQAEAAAQGAQQAAKQTARLTDEERVLVDNIDNGMPRLKDKGIVSLRWAAARMLIDAIRRLDGE